MLEVVWRATLTHKWQMRSIIIVSIITYLNYNKNVVF